MHNHLHFPASQRQFATARHPPLARRARRHARLRPGAHVLGDARRARHAAARALLAHRRARRGEADHRGRLRRDQVAQGQIGRAHV